MLRAQLRSGVAQVGLALASLKSSPAAGMAARPGIPGGCSCACLDGDSRYVDLWSDDGNSGWGRHDSARRCSLYDRRRAGVGNRPAIAVHLQ